MFHFVKDSLSTSLILHRFAWAKFSFYKSFPCPFSHPAQVRLSQSFRFVKSFMAHFLILHRLALANVLFCESFPAHFLIRHRFGWTKVFILWKLPFPLLSFWTGPPWPMFHFAKASLASTLILHTFALANFSFCKSSLDHFLILHRFALANVFILWKLRFPLLSFCTGSPEPKFSFCESFPGLFSHSAQVCLDQWFIL